MSHKKPLPPLPGINSHISSSLSIDSANSPKSNTSIERKIRDYAAKLYLIRSQEAKQWIEAFLGVTIGDTNDILVTQHDNDASHKDYDPNSPPHDLIDHLRDGEFLLRLVAPFVKDPSTISIHRNINPESRMAFMKATDNIQQFIDICVSELGMPRIYMFSVSDLWERRNITNVVHCVHALAHFLEKNGYIGDGTQYPALKRLMEKSLTTDALLSGASQRFKYNPLLLRRIEDEFKQMDEKNINVHSLLEFGFDEISADELTLDELHLNEVDSTVHVPSCRVESLTPHLTLGDTLQLRVQLRNSQGTPLRDTQTLHTVAVEIIQNLDSGDTVVEHLSFKDLGDGCFGLQIPTDQLGSTGDYEIRCTLDGESLAPLRITVQAGTPSALHTQIVDDSGLNTHHFEGYLYKFVVRVMDAQGNPVHDQNAVNLEPALTYLMGNAQLKVQFATHVESCGSALYAVHFVTPLPGHYKMSLSLNSQIVNQFPFSFEAYKLDDPLTHFVERAHGGSTQLQHSVIQGEMFLVAHEQESSPVWLSLVAERLFPPNTITPFLTQLEHEQLNTILNEQMRQWIGAARSEAFQYHLNPKSVDPEFDDEQILQRENLNAGDTLWFMVEKHVPNREQLLLKALQDVCFMAHNPLQRVVLDMERRDWNDYEELQRTLHENEDKRSSAMLHQFSLSNNESELIYDPLHPRVCSLSFWVWCSQMIAEAKQRGKQQRLDAAGKISTYTIPELTLREYADLDSFNFCRKNDVKSFAELQLRIAQRFIFEIIDEMRQKLGDRQYQALQARLQSLGQETFIEFKKNHEMFLTILTRTNYLGEGPLNMEVTKGMKTHSKPLISALRRQYLILIRDTIITYKDKLLVGALNYSSSEANSFMFSTQLMKTKLSDLWNGWLLISQKALSDTPRKIMVQHLLFPLPPNSFQQVKRTDAYSVQVPLNKYFDSTITTLTNLSIRDRNTQGILNPWKVAFLKNNAVVFEALRSGCLSVACVGKDSETRRQIALQNAYDLLRFSAMNHAKRFQREELQELITKRRALEIPFTSLSLMTPFFLPDREDRIALEHAQCLLEALDSNQVTNVLVDLHDQREPLRIAVKFSKPCLVNFGTNIAMKTFKRGLTFQRMLNCRKYGMRRFELKVNQFLYDVGRRKRALRETILAWLSQYYFTSSRESIVYKQAIDERTFHIERCFVLREKRRHELANQIALLDQEVAQLQQKLEQMLQKHILPNINNVTQLEILSKWKVSSVVNDILKHHHEIYNLEVQYQDMEEQIVWEDQFVKELKVMFNHRTVTIPDAFNEYVDLAQREKDVWLLYHEVRHIYHNYKHEDFAQAVYETEDVSKVDPYAISVRMSLITFSLGEQLHFNCKSGGSRTGELHDQILEYCEWRYQFGAYPASKKAHKTFNDHRRTIHSIVALNGCTHDIYRVNTGVPGSGADKNIAGRFLPGLYKKYRGLAGFDSLTYTNSLIGADKEVKKYQKMAESAS